MLIKEKFLRKVIHTLLLEQSSEYKEGESGYEYKKENDKIYITASPRSKASRSKPKYVNKNKHPAAWNAIVSRYYPELLDIPDPESTPDPSIDDLEVSPIDTDLIDDDHLPKDSNDSEFTEPIIDTEPSSSLTVDDLIDSDQETEVFSQFKLKNWNEIKFKSWLNTASDTIEAIQWGGKNYLSLGYGAPQDEYFKGKEGVIVKIPYNNVYRKIQKKYPGSIHIIPVGTRVKLTKGGGGVLTTKKGQGTINALIKWGTPGVSLITDTVDIAPGSSVGHRLSTVLDVFGAVPVLGAPADAINTYILISLVPPLYFSAVLTLIGVIPGLGEIAAGMKAVGMGAKAVKATTGAKQVVDFIASSPNPTLRELIHGKSFITRVKEYKGTFFNFLYENIDAVKSYIPGGELSRQTVKGFENYLDEFLKFYKYYRSISIVRVHTEFARWLSLTARGRGGLFEEATKKAIDASGLEPELRQTGVVEAFNVQPSSSIGNDIAKVVANIPEKIEDYTPEQEKSLSKLMKLLEDQNPLAA